MSSGALERDSRVLVHLSDLHFGRLAPDVIEPLHATIDALAPTLVAVSGDLTQRARPAQFREARTFLDRIRAPRLVVPGNHDVPLYDVASRFIAPLRNYRRHISEDLEPFYGDPVMAVMGVNTARSLTIKNGRINRRQMERVRARFASVEPGVVRVLVTHHPFELPRWRSKGEVVGRATRALRLFAGGLDLLLAGHFHTADAWISQHAVVPGASGVLLIQAGTATSSRMRGETNSFNVLRISRERIEVSRLDWNPATGGFGTASSASFVRDGRGWRPESGDELP